MNRPAFSALLRRGVLGIATCSAALSATGYSAPLDLFWPQFRHDAARSNFSPGTAQLNLPAVKWRFPLGGETVSAHLFDADLDGVDDVISIEGGRVTARRTSGQVLWSSPQLAALSIAGLGDVDGDGTLDIAVAALNRAHIVRSSDGVVLWSSAVQTPRLDFLALDDFDGDGAPDIAVGASQGGSVPQPTTQIVGFAPAQKAIATTAQAPTADDKGSISGQWPVDVDGDGVLDLLLPGYTHFYAYSGKTGAPLGQSAAFATIGGQAQACGTFRPDPAQPPIVLYATDVSAVTYLWHGIAAMQLHNGALQVLWSHLLPEATTQHYVTVRGSIADIDGDGVGEVIAAQFDQGVWSLEARDAQTGTVLHTLAAAQMPGNGAGGPFLRGIVRMGGAQRATLVIQRTDVAAVPSLGPLTLWQWSRETGFVQYADIGTGALSTANLRAAGSDPIPQPQTWGTAQPTQGDLLVFRDTDGDNAIDQLDQLRVNNDGQFTPVTKLPLPIGAQVLGIAATGPGLSSALVRGLRDGTVGLLASETGALGNDANKDGLADLRFGGVVDAYVAVAPIHDADKLGRILVSGADSVNLLDTSAAGPMTPPVVALALPAPTLGTRGNFADVNGDGQRDIVVRSTSKTQVVSLAAFGMDGAALWSYQHPNGPWAWGGAYGDPFAIADLNGDGADDFVCEWDLAGAAGQNRLMTVISGKTGTDLWPAAADCRLGATAFSLDLLSTPRRILSAAYNYRYSCDSVSGKVLEQLTNKEPRYGVAMLIDLDGDGVQEQVLCGSTGGLAAEKTVGFQTLWTVAVPGAYQAPGALVLAGGTPLAAHGSASQPTIQVVTAQAGQPVWAFGYVGGKQVAVADAALTGFAAVGLLAAADLTGAGHPALLFRTTEGYLYCVNALTGAVDWALNWGGAFGDPLVADIDGDGQLEILVSYSDGALYALDHGNLQPVAWVRENAGNGPALDDASDIDQQEDTQTLHVNWAAVAGAQGYAVSVLDQNGATVLPAQAFGAVTAATLTGLTMHLNQHYTTAVQAYSSSGPDQAFAPTTLSDGVTIVDLSPPWIDGQQLLPSAVLAGNSIQIIADLHDKTAIHDWAVQIAPTGGAPAVWQQKFNVSQPNIHVALTWPTTVAGQPPPAGDYVVHLEVHDGAQHSAAVDLVLHLCGATPVSATACTPGYVTADGGGSGSDVSSAPQTVPEGCGCRIATAGATVPPGAALLVLACLWALWRARGPGRMR